LERDVGKPLSELLFTLPSVRALLGSVVDDLVSRQNVILLLPRGISADQVRLAVARTLQARRFDGIKLVPLPDLAGDCTPEASLCALFGVPVDSGDPEVLRVELLRFLSPKMLLLHGWEGLPGPRRAEWLEFVVRWAELLKRSEGAPVPSLVMFVAVPFELLGGEPPFEDVGLSVYWWWGVPSVLEVRSLWRNLTSSDSGDFEARWAEVLYPTMSGGDLCLLDELLGTDEPALENARDFLRDFAIRRGWSAEALVAARASHVLGFSFGDMAPARPPERFRTLWAMGAVMQTPEDGVQLHSAALSLLGLEQRYSQRLWKAQIELVFPLLNEVRLLICEAITKSEGQGWADRWETPQDPRDWPKVSESSLNCEWAHLLFLLTARSELTAHRRWLPIVREAIELRNLLAHGQPISLEDARRFVGLVTRTFRRPGPKRFERGVGPPVARN
jgi:hypothetical protein